MNTILKSKVCILFIVVLFRFSGYGNTGVDSLLKVIRTSANDSVISYAYLTLSEFTLLNNPKQALEYINKSITYFQKFSSNFQSTRYLKKVTIFRLLGNLDSSIYYNNMVYANAIKYNNPVALAEAYGEYGSISVSQNNFQKAIEYFTKQITVIKKNKFKREISGVYNNMGIAYGNKGDWDMASEYFSRALKDDELNNRIASLGNDYNNLGVVCIINHKLDGAKSYFLKSLNYRIRVNDSLGIGGSYNNLALLENEKGNYKGALLYTDSAIAIAELNDYKKLKVEIYDSYDQIYSKMGDYKMAYESLSKKNKLNAVFEKEKFNEDIHQLETNIQAEQNQSQLLQKNLELTKSENQKQKQLAILAIAAVLIVALIIFLYYFFKNNKVLKTQNVIISNQKYMIEEKHKDIKDSITYAHRIQSALIPTQHQLSSQYAKIEILFKPKDIVSGDFYKYSKVKELNIFVLADCTGHGVPGAFMSIIGINCLDTLINEKGITEPHRILNELKTGVVNSLNPDLSNTDKKDGMDVALISFTKDKLIFSGANQSIFVLRNKELIVFKGNKQPIGLSEKQEEFTSITFNLLPADRIILFSDGIVDQFGGTEGKKLKVKEFKNWLIETASLTLREQHSEIETRLNAFMLNYEQTDDITMAIIEI